MTATYDVSRRTFLSGSTAAAAGLSLGFHIPFGGDAAAAAGTSPEINAWVAVKPDDTVVIRVARVEMGQGSLTGLAQLVAEELECDWSKVTTEYPTPGQNVARNRVWGDFQTAGSRAIRGSQEYVRKGGAIARTMLIQAAADEWKVPASECKAAKSVITHAPSGRTTTFGKVSAAAAKLEPPKDVPLKDPKDWTIVGKPVKRLDTADKLTGKQVYAVDVKLPGMVNAAIKACPVFGGKRKSFEAAKVEGMPGVKRVVPVGDDAVAVVAETWWQAKTALDALPIVWDEGANAKVSSETIDAMLKEGLEAKEAFIGNEAGDARAAIAGAAKRIEAVYSYPYQHHVTMEPMNATALYRPDRCEVWTATQNAEAALAATAAASGLPIGQCEVYRHHLGGGFGRRSTSHDYVRQAVLIAKEMPGTPVKLLWSREEDMLHGHYHPVTQCKMVGALDAKGELTGLHMRISGQSILATVRPDGLQNGRDPATFQGLNPGGAEGAFGYTVPNLLIDHAMRNPPVPPGFWRGVNNNQNAIYVECFMDELAQAAGPGSARLPAQADGEAPEAPRGAERRRRGDRLGQAGSGRRASWARAADGFRQLRRGCRRGLDRRCRQAQDPPHRRRHRLRLRGQSGADRAADRRLLRLRPDGRALRRDHLAGRARRAGELRHLRDDAHQRDAEGRQHRADLRRLLGRRRRADHLRGGSGGAQRAVRGDGQAHPLAAAEGS